MRRTCSIRAVLSFLQDGLEERLSPSTLKVYVAAHHNAVEGKSLGKAQPDRQLPEGGEETKSTLPTLYTLL